VNTFKRKALRVRAPPDQNFTNIDGTRQGLGAGESTLINVKSTAADRPYTNVTTSSN
jgi:hypothetical protein